MRAIAVSVDLQWTLAGSRICFPASVLASVAESCHLQRKGTRVYVPTHANTALCCG